MALNDRHAKILEARGLDAELLEKLGVDSSTKLDGDCIRIPYFENGVEVNAKYRTIGGEKRFCQEPNARKCFWNADVITDLTLEDQPLIVTEGELDAIAAIQAGFGRVVSVPDGAPAEAVGESDAGAKYSYVSEAQGALRDVREIILCTDSDAPGVNLLNDLALRFGRARCKWVRYPKGCKDLADALKTYGVRGVVETINRAQWMKVDGIYRMSDLPPIAEARVYDVGITGLEPHYNIRRGDFCIVTGIPSHGKSSFIGDVACHMVARYDWHVAFASFEQRPQIDHRRNLRTWFNRKMVKHQSAQEIADADAWIDRYFTFLVPGEDDDVTLAWTLERLAAAVIQHGASLVIVDPWNEMDHIRPPDMSLTEYTGFAIKQFRKFAFKYQVHVIVAAHPAKQKKNDEGKYSVPTLYDISDSAHWYNKADIGIVIHRDEQTLIRVAKSRYHDQIGKPGDMGATFDIESGRFTIIEPDVWANR